MGRKGEEAGGGTFIGGVDNKQHVTEPASHVTAHVLSPGAHLD